MVNKEWKKYKKINVDIQTFDTVKYLSRALNKPIASFMRELFGHVLTSALQFKMNGLNIAYKAEYDNLILEFSGSSAIEINHFSVSENTSDEQVDEIVNKHMQERIKRDIIEAEQKNKEVFNEE